MAQIDENFLETFDGLEIYRIPFSQLVTYWIEVDHFKDPQKVYTEVLSHLGPYQSTIENPRRISYGLFHSGKMIGATHVCQWNPDWIRFRTINIRQAYRCHDLGWKFLRRILEVDWSEHDTLFGWFRRTAHDWALRHGFHEMDGKWHGQHIGMLRKIR